MASFSSAEPRYISYFTDVEGNLDYFRRWVDISPAVSWSQDGKSLNLFEDHGVVFGGDLFDKVGLLKYNQAVGSL